MRPAAPRSAVRRTDRERRTRRSPPTAPRPACSRPRSCAGRRSPSSPRSLPSARRCSELAGEEPVPHAFVTGARGPLRGRRRRGDRRARRGSDDDGRDERRRAVNAAAAEPPRGVAPGGARRGSPGGGRARARGAGRGPEPRRRGPARLPGRRDLARAARGARLLDRGPRRRHRHAGHARTLPRPGAGARDRAAKRARHDRVRSSRPAGLDHRHRRLRGRGRARRGGEREAARAAWTSSTGSARRGSCSTYLVKLEDEQVTYYTAEAPAVDSVDLTTTSAEIAGCQAQHIVVLRSELGDRGDEAAAEAARTASDAVPAATDAQ